MKMEIYMSKAPITPISVSIPDAGKMLGVSRSRAWELAKEGKIKTVMIGHRRVALVSSLRALVGETEAA
jgi:predicted DNA-binding transcriptional regulator AlpA